MPLFLSLLLLLLGNPARANYGWSGSVSIQGADPAPLQEHPTVAIEEELLHLAVGNSDHEPVAQWSVLYRFRNHGDESVHVEGVFPVELLLGPLAMRWPARAGAAARALGDLVGIQEGADVSRGSSRDEEGSFDVLYCLDSPLDGPLSPFETTIEPEQAEALGLRSFRATQDGRVLDLGPPRLEVESLDPDTLPTRLATSHDIFTGDAAIDTPEEMVQDDECDHLVGRDRPMVVHRVTVDVPFSLELRPHAWSELAVQYQTLIPFTGGSGNYHYALSYLLGSGASWLGPIGDLWLMIDRGALQVDRPPELPFDADPFPLGDAVVWHVSDYEPDDHGRIVVAGHAPTLAEYTGLPAHREHPPRTVYDGWTDGWVVEMAPSTPALAASASSVLDRDNRFPFATSEVILTKNQGFGVDNVSDGDPVTAWCSEAADEDAQLQLTLPVRACGLEVFLGNHNRWAWIDCENEDFPNCAVRPNRDGPWDEIGEFALAPTSMAGRFPKPAGIDLLDEGGELLARLPADAERTVVFNEELEPGTYTIRAHRSAEGPVCISEILVDTMAPDGLSELLDALGSDYSLERPPEDPSPWSQ